MAEVHWLNRVDKGSSHPLCIHQQDWRPAVIHLGRVSGRVTVPLAPAEQSPHTACSPLDGEAAFVERTCGGHRAD